MCAVDAEALERTLRDDLRRVRARFADEKFMMELYRGLTNRAWRKVGGPDGHVALSWSRAEELVNELRREVGEPPLELAQSGGEGDVSPTVAEELAALGWVSTPLETSEHDEGHVSKGAASPPPRDTGRRMVRDPQTREWERRAHEEASTSTSHRAG
jgi:hypothetical protein